MTANQQRWLNRATFNAGRIRIEASSPFYSAVAQIVVAVSSLTGIRVYTELLGRDDFGLAMLAMGGVALLDGLVVMALSQTLLSICAGLPSGDGQRQVAVGLSFRMFRTLAVALGPLALAGFSLSAVLPIDAALAFAPSLALAYLAEEIAKTSMLAPLVARREYIRFSLWQAAEALVTLVLTGLSLLYVKANVFGFLVALIFARTCTTSAFSYIYFDGRYFLGIELAASSQYLSTAIGYGAPVSAMAPIGWVGAYFDRYVITATAGLAGAGMYAAVIGLVSRPYGITSSTLTNYFRPMLFQIHGLGEQWCERRRIERRWIVAAAAIGLAGAVAFALLAGQLVTMALAADYRAGAPAIMIVLSLSQTLTIMTHAVDNAVLSTGSSGRLLRLQVWLVMVSLVLVPLSALPFGALGAAIGRLLSEAVKFGATLMLSRKILCRRGVSLR